MRLFVFQSLFYFFKALPAFLYTGAQGEPGSPHSPGPRRARCAPCPLERGRGAGGDGAGGPQRADRMLGQNAPKGYAPSGHAPRDDGPEWLQHDVRIWMKFTHARLPLHALMFGCIFFLLMSVTCDYFFFSFPFLSPLLLYLITIRCPCASKMQLLGA